MHCCHHVLGIEANGKQRGLTHPMVASVVGATSREAGTRRSQSGGCFPTTTEVRCQRPSGKKEHLHWEIFGGDQLIVDPPFHGACGGLVSN